MKKVVILGSTGSIGTQALEVIRQNLENFQVVALAAGGNSPASRELFQRQCSDFLDENNKHQVAMASIDGQAAVERLADTSATGADIVLNAMAGNVGLKATLTALRSIVGTDKKLALANKESLVIGGGFVCDILQGESMLKYIHPVDSEHSAIWQCLTNGGRPLGCAQFEGEQSDSIVSDKKSALANPITKLILTASGGAFRGRKRAELEKVTPEDALKHPTWSMGQLVTINSATLMNKGLELIEAAYLFDIDPRQIEVTIHPTSEVHSFVQFQDGSTLAQMSPPTMKLPIGYALSAPWRLKNIATASSFDKAFSWDFTPVDESAFGAVNIARDALISGPLYPVVMNAVNEKAVYDFLAGRIGFLEIIEKVKHALDEFEPRKFAANPSEPTLDEILEIIEHYT